MRSRCSKCRSTSDTAPAWLDGNSGVAVLVAQAEAVADRDWTFGWLRMAEGTRRTDLEASLRRSGGESRRVRPGGCSGCTAAGGCGAASGPLPGFPAWMGSVFRRRPNAKLMGFDVVAEIRSITDAVPVFVTLMADDPGRSLARRTDRAWARPWGATIRRSACMRPTSPPVSSMPSRPPTSCWPSSPSGSSTPAHDTAVSAMGADALRFHAGSAGHLRGNRRRVGAYRRDRQRAERQPCRTSARIGRASAA